MLMFPNCYFTLKSTNAGPALALGELGGRPGPPILGGRQIVEQLFSAVCKSNEINIIYINVLDFSLNYFLNF
jgi:hypothetical protein